MQIQRIKMIEEIIEKLELRLLDPRVRQSESELLELLHEDFTEFGSSGQVYDRGKVISALIRADDIRCAEVSQFRCRQDGNTVYAQYSLKVTDRQESFRLSLRSSVWVKEGQGWLMIFHQGTKV